MKKWNGTSSMSRAFDRYAENWLRRLTMTPTFDPSPHTLQPNRTVYTADYLAPAGPGFGRGAGDGRVDARDGATPCRP